MTTISNSILDYIATRGSENRVIDLADVFSGTGLTYSVQSSDPSIADVAIEDGKLVIDYADTLGYTDLKITATDSLGQSVTDNVRVRVAGENAYTIAVLPDTQDYTNAARIETLKGMTQWVVDNKDSLNIAFLTNVGDMTQENGTAHWTYLKDAYETLNGEIPYSLTLGNHDGVSSSYSNSLINEYFPVDYLQQVNPETFGDTYDQEPGLSNNSYSTFTAPDGTKWMVLNLEFGPREDVLRWAGEVIEEHLDHRVILSNHSYMNWGGRHDATGAPLYDEGTGYDYGLANSNEAATDGETMYRALVQKYSNITFTFSGHIFGDGAETLVSYDQFGNPVYQMMMNYQNGVSSEITSDAGQGSGSAGGNGAIRLLTIDPDNGAVYTSTYFSALYDYMDSVRGDGEPDRDGLTGPYRGHEETITGVDLGAPEVPAIAKAGNDQFVSAEAGQEKASVTLDGDWTLNPNDDDGLAYVWTDVDGNVVANGATPTLELEAGQHRFTLTVTDSAGHVSTDEVRIVVADANTLLVDNFNDGDAAGWGAPGEAQGVSTGTPAEYGIAALPGAAPGTASDVTFIPKLTPSQGLTLTPAAPLPTGVYVLKSYTMAFDILVPASGVTSYVGLIQTDLANASDGDFFIRNNNNGTGGIGIGGNYPGAFKFDQWQRVVVKIETAADGSAVMSKYIDGVKMGTQGVDSSRYAIDLAKGLLLFSDEDGETADLYASSFLFTDKLYTDAEIAALGGVKAGGIVDGQPTPYSVQIDFSEPGMRDEWDAASVQAGEIGAGVGAFIVKGTANSRDTVAEGQDALEGRVFEQSDAANKLLVWQEAAAKTWSNYAFEATLKTTDNDATGLVFYYTDAGNFYKVVLDAETNSRSLVKVQNGVETMLASEHGGTPWSRDFQLKVVIVDGKVSAFLDGHSLFGEVVDASPLTGGSVGFFSHNQRSSQFDNVTVNKVALTAHAGDDLRPVDADGDGQVTIDLDAGASYGLLNIVKYVWTDADGNVVALGEQAGVTLDAVTQVLTLTVTDASGKTATDKVTIDAVSQARVLLSEGFGGSDFSRWTIVDEGESGGVGADGKSSQWELQDGALVQLSDLKSRQLEWNGASNPDPWKTGWSPLGDGVNMLRKGTYALYNDAAAKEWTDYAVEATIKSPDNGALGLLFYYQDANNYYKLELDANGDYDRNPGNGAGSLFQLIQVKDGVEKYLNQFPAKYTPGEALQLRVEVKDGKIQAYVDGLPLFAYAIEDHAQSKGTVGLFSWDSAGVSFDDVLVYDLSSESALPPGGPILGTAGDDELTGTAGDDVILAVAGDDAVLAGAGNDTVEGGDGDDVLGGGEGNDLIEGGEGDDELAGGVGDDVLQGGAGDDLLDGGEGVDTADYGDDTAGVTVDLAAGSASGDEAGEDELVSIENVIGGVGDDVIAGNAGDNRLNGGTGRDTLVLAAATGAIALDLAAGTVRAEGLGSDVFTGVEAFRLGSGDDRMTIAAGAETISAIDGGAGHDTLVLTGNGKLGQLEAVEAVELAGDWTLTDEGYDVAFGDGAQRLTLAAALLGDGGFAGTVSAFGQEDSIVLSDLAATEATLGAGNLLTITGAASGPLTLQLDPAQDFAGMGFALASDGQGGVVLTYAPANGGDDVLTGGNGDDVLDGGAGNDTLKGAAGDDTLLGGQGEDQIDGGSGDDVIDGGVGDDTIKAGSGDDQVTGGEGDDVIDAGSGDDIVLGGAGRDVIDGGSGDDRIEGGAGDDMLSGGSGHDA
ncbi:MAG TPA: family 16 glycoside hydrolase, partial [Bosea sp. (in: a-proteobacteria)]